MGFVCSKRDLLADETEFVGKGIQPDLWVDYSINNFLEGKDEAIETALEYFEAKKLVQNKK